MLGESATPSPARPTPDAPDVIAREVVAVMACASDSLRNER